MLLLVALWTLLIWSPDAEQPLAVPDDQLELQPSVAMAPAPAPPPTAAKPTPTPAPQVAAEPELEPSEEPASPRFKLPKMPPPEAKGPVGALKLRFGDESPAASSKQHEQQLTEALRRTGPPAQSIEDVVCRRTVCRVSWRWKAEHVIPFGQALGALGSFDRNPGVDAAGPVNPDGSHAVAIYVDITASK